MSDHRDLQRSTMRKIYLRLLPFAALSYILAYMDRINVSFAGLTMRRDLGLSATEFRISDRMNERRWNLLAACMLSTGGLVLAGHTTGTWWALLGMSLAAIGFYGSKGPFFARPPMLLSGTGLGAAFAWIVAIGNLGGTVGPYYVGYMKDLTDSFSGGLYGLALMGLVAALVCAFLLNISDHVAMPDASTAEVHV